LLKSGDNQPSQAAIGRTTKQHQSIGLIELINVKQVSNLD